MKHQRRRFHTGQERSHVHGRIELDALRRDLRRPVLTEGIGEPALYLGRSTRKRHVRKGPPGQTPVTTDQFRQGPHRPRPGDLHAAWVRRPQREPRDALRVLRRVRDADCCAVEQAPQVEPLQSKVVNDGRHIGNLRLKREDFHFPLRSAYPTPIKAYIQASSAKALQSGAALRISPVPPYVAAPGSHVNQRRPFAQGGVGDAGPVGAGAEADLRLHHALLPPPHLVQPHRVLEPPQRHVAPVREQEPLARRQFPHDDGGQDLARLGVGAYAGGQLDGGAEQVFLLGHRLPRVEADAYADGDVGVRFVVLGESTLDGDGAFQGAARRSEGGHDAVAGVLDLGAAVGLQGVADDAVVRPQHLLGLGVAQALGEGSGALHVREEDGVNVSRSGRLSALCGLLALAQELVDCR